MRDAAGTTLTRQVVEELRQAASAALALEDGGDPRWAWRGVVDGTAFVAAVRRHRLASLLAPMAVDLLMPADVVARLRALRRRDEYTALQVAFHVRQVHRLLHEAEVDALFFKGPALAVQTTGSVARRGAGDVDVLVDPRDLATAYRVLADGGFVPDPTNPEPGASWAWRWTQAVYYEIGFAGEHAKIDLHWHLDQNRGGLPTMAEAWGRRHEVDLGGGTVPTLSLSDALDHACRHASKDRWSSLRSMVDIHRLALRDPRPLADAPDATRRAARLVHEHLVADPAGAGLRYPRVSRHQRRPLPGAVKQAVGIGAVAAFFQHSANAGTSADVARNAARSIMPPHAVGGIDDVHVLRALPRAVVQRVRIAAQRDA